MTRTILLFAFLLWVPATVVIAQNSGAFEEAQKYRDQVSQLNDREAEIKIRLTELDYQLKPENIEREFSSVGSVHPEELREARRKQLQTEKDRLVAQLSEINLNRSNLQTQIQIAESKAYQQSAIGKDSLKPRQSWFGLLMTGNVFRVAALTFALIVVAIALVFANKRRQAATDNQNPS
jgi:hypothetical protein